MKKLKLTIGHMYPEEMNIYGDMGNIITLKKRCEWRDIKVEIKKITQDSKYLEESISDLYFMGGGQDNDMYGVFEDIVEQKKDFLIEEIEKDKVFLLICGAFELFGKYFLDSNGRKIEGLDILPIETKAPGSALKDRCLGNILYDINKNYLNDIKDYYSDPKSNSIVGFENHSGQVYFLNDDLEPIGEVKLGKGNNTKDKKEGAILNNIFGSFTHGSLLPKNPHFSDYLITKALRNKYKKNITLEPLDDEIEWKAHIAIKNKLLGN